MRAITSTPCELCKRPSSLYCHSDAAFLCHSCDAAVHQANFLVARHLRHPLCSTCTSFCPRSRCFSGTGIRHPKHTLCNSCSLVTFSDDHQDYSSTSSSTCISTAESSAAPTVEKIGSGRNHIVDGTGDASSSSSESEVSCRKLNRRATVRIVRRQRGTAGVICAKREGVIASWCDRLGLGPTDSAGAVPRRVQLLALSLAESGSCGLPLRVSLAASFWLALRFCGMSSAPATATWETLLERVEAVSGVPRKLVVAASAKVAQRAARPTKAAKPDDLDLDLQEGWAECSA